MSLQLHATALGLVAIVLWSTNAGMTMQAVAALGPLTTVMVMGGGAGLALALFDGFRQGRWNAAFAIDRRYAWSGALCFSGYVILFDLAYHLAPEVGAGLRLGLINYLWPFLVLLWAVAFGGRVRWPWLLLGMVTGGAGIAVAFMGSVNGSAHAASAAVAPAFPAIAGLTMFAAAVIWSFFCHLPRLCHADGGTALFFLVAAILAAGLRLIFPETPQWGRIPPGALVYAVIGPTAAAYACWEAGMRRGDVAWLAVASYTLPLLSALFAAWYLGQALPPGLALGATGMVVGALISRRGLTLEPPRQEPAPVLVASA
jgi:drug/metabolite transporter (DMT)-like permease